MAEGRNSGDSSESGTYRGVSSAAEENLSQPRGQLKTLQEEVPPTEI
jgi:hypothetical protein